MMRSWVGGGWRAGVMIALVVISVVLIIVMALYDQRQWEKFRDEHHCKVVERIAGEWRTSTHWVSDSNGGSHMVTGSSRSVDRTVWLCDDGVRYTR